MTAAVDANPPEPPVFTIARLFAAPRALVWQAFTESECLMHWWGPKGFRMISCTLELRPGGIFHYGLRTPDGQDMWGRFVYREIVAPERLVFIVSFANEAGNVIRHPWNPDWPLQTLSTVTFAEHDGGTKLAVQWVPHLATEAEERAFTAGHDSMQQGWSGTLDQLDRYLAAASTGRDQ